MKNFFEFSDKLKELDKDIMSKCSEIFSEIDKTRYYNQQKVLSAFVKNQVSESHFAASTGYGYGDRGRDLLEKVFADCMGAEDSLIRHNFVSGTHALTVALFGLLRPGDKMLCLTGRPYDTLVGVLGIEEPVDGSLADFGIIYDEVPLDSEGKPQTKLIARKLKSDTYKIAYIQRSRGYSLRPSLTIEKISELVKCVKSVDDNIIVFVDNCYGEFVEAREPTEVGADIIVGSLIKNPGGGIAPTGGYIAGKHELVEKCAYRLTAPGVGREVGASLGHLRELYMGVFNSPHVVGEALKTAVYASALFSELGYQVTPNFDEYRGDIIQAILLENEDALIVFCRGVQSGAPIDSFVTPEPWDMPGYNSKVIMAAGAFTNGASIELSADAPLREPFAVWMQGSLTFDSGRTGMLLAAQTMMDKNLI